MAKNLSSVISDADPQQLVAVAEPSDGVYLPRASHQELGTAVRWQSMLPLLPIGAVAFFIIVASAIFIGFRSLLPYPVSPWEAGIVTDAWRMLQGDAIYAVGGDHATHMYGPLVTVFLAQVFRFTGPVLQLGRLMSALSGIAVVVLLARMIIGRGDRLALGVAAALLLTANTRTLNYFTETRPDMDSLLFATLAIIALYLGLEPVERKPRLALVLTGSALLVIAVLFKQTAAAFMLIPALALAGRFRKPSSEIRPWPPRSPLRLCCSHSERSGFSCPACGITWWWWRRNTPFLFSERGGSACNFLPVFRSFCLPWRTGFSRTRRTAGNCRALAG